MGDKKGARIGLTNCKNNKVKLMGYILEYVEVDELSKTVKFFGSEKRIEVDDLDVGLSAFYSECNDVAMEINGCSSLIEKTAFNRVT